MIDLRDPTTLEALLGRRPVDPLAAGDRRAFSEQRVLITGAGGSVGRELAHILSGCAPARLTLLDQSEYQLFRLEQELTQQHPAVHLDVVLGDVTRPAALRHACRLARPHVVYHAAAYKHVTMTERAVCQAVEVNVFGTHCVLHAARDVGARLVLVSTDKAAQPRSVMGASKRLAELVTLSAATATFRPVVVRFGNVLGSSGSVLEVMLDHLRAGRPIPVTDPAATRFFMTPSEAASLVLVADRLGVAGETYWLDVGEPIRIIDLARRLLGLATRQGLSPVPIELIGLRPGEKLREELAAQGVGLCRTAHGHVWRARQAPVDGSTIEAGLRILAGHLGRRNAHGTLGELAQLVPDFTPSLEALKLAAASRVVATVPPAPRALRPTA